MFSFVKGLPGRDGQQGLPGVPGEVSTTQSPVYP